MDNQSSMPSYTDFDTFVSTPVSNGFASGTNPSYLRLAMHGDFSEKTMQEIADNQALADRMGVTPELATDNPDLKTEDTIRQMEKNPAAENFVKQDERHIAALKEDGQGLLDTYNVLVDKNMVFGYDDGKDNNEGTATNQFMPYGTDISNATKRSQLQQQLSMLGEQAWANSDNPELQAQYRDQILAIQKEMSGLKVESGAAKAWEQMHRMFSSDIPQAAHWAAQGAVGGGTIGSFLPGVGTAVGAAAGGAAGFVGGMFKAVSKSEIGNFYAEMLTMKDDAGNYIDPARAKWGAYAYGNLSAVIETASDAVFGKVASKAVAPVKAAARSYFRGEIMKDTIKSLVKDTSMWRVFAPLVGGMATTTLTESTEEAAQSLLSTAIQNSIKRSLNEEGKSYFRGDIPLIGEEGWKEAKENFLETAQIAPWFFLAPGLMRFSADMHLRNKAIQFVDGNKALAESLENSKTKQTSPIVAESYMQAAGLTGSVNIPANEAMALQKNGVDLASIMGWDVNTMQEAADLGQDLTFPLARLQANLDKDSMFKVADVMRETPESLSLKDAQEVNDNAQGDFDNAARLWMEESEQNNAVAVEAERIERELNEVVRSTGGLQAQIKSSTDKGTTSGQYVRNAMRLIGAYAQRIEAATGIPVAETLARFNLRGVNDARRVQERLAEFGMDKAKKLIHLRKIVDPDFQAAWGKISRAEFIKYFEGMKPGNPKQARKFAMEQVKRIEGKGMFGPGFWAPNGTGLSPDKVAISAPEWHADSKFGFRAPDEQVNLNEFLDRIMRSNEEVFGTTDIDEVLRKYGLDEDPIAASVTDGLLQSMESEIVAEVTAEKAKQIGLPEAAPIVAREGDLSAVDGKKNRLEQFKKEGFANAKEYVQYVLSSVDAVYKGSPGTYMFVRRGETKDGRVVAELEVRYDTGSKQYRVTTAHPMRKDYFKNKKPLWERAQSSHSDNGTPSAVTGQSGVLEESINLTDVTVNRLNQSQGTTKARGATYIDLTNDRYVIELFNGANFSTLLHELGHVFTLEMQRLVKTGQANEQMVKDMMDLENWTSSLYDPAVHKKEYDKYQKDSVYGGRDFETLTPEELNASRDRARNEWFARGFEQYLAEGRAPSSKLQGMFQRFARWLNRVYKQIRDLDVQINDKVRAVFDRMLAAEEDMDIVASQANISDFSKQALDDLGVRGRERLRLEGLINDAKTEAANQLRRARDKNHEAQLARWDKEARELIKKDPVFQVKKLMRSKDLFFDYDEIAEMYGKAEADALMKIMPGAVSKDGRGNTSLEATAADYGFDSGLDMIDAVKTGKSQEQFVKDYIDERQAEHDANFSPVDDLIEQPEIAEMQEEIAVALQAKIEGILKEKLYQKEREGKTLGGESIQPTQEQYEDFGSKANWIATREELQRRAENKLDVMRMDVQIRPENFRKQAMREMQNERNFILRKDWGRAIEANYKTRLNLALSKLSAERQKLVNRLQKQSKQAMESKDVSPAIRAAVYKLCKQYGIQSDYTQKAEKMVAGKDWSDIEKAIRDLEDRGFLTAGTVDQDIFTREGKPWQIMSWNEYKSVYESLDGLIKAERYRNYIDTVEGREELDKLCKTIGDQIRTGKKIRPSVINEIKTKWGKRKDWAKDLAIYGGLNLDTQMFLCDGVDRGPLWQAIYRPISQATWKRTAILQDMTTKWKEMLSTYTQEEQEQMKQQYKITAGGKTFPMTKVRAIMILLNMGNEGNLSRLINMVKEENRKNGIHMEGVALEYITNAVNSLEEKDVNFVEGIWDYFATFKKEAFDIEERCTKTRPKEVTPIPVTTKFRTLKGGYFPIKYDGETSMFMSNAEEFGTVTNYMVPASVDHSFTKDRSESPVAGRSLKLDDIMVIPEHLAQVAHTLAFRETIQNVGKIVMHPEVASAIEQTLGPSFYKVMVGNIKYVAGQRPAVTRMSKGIAYLRKSASLAAMAWSLATSLVQISGGLTTINQLGLKYTLRGFGYSIKNGIATTSFNGLKPRCEMYQQVCEKSQMMKHRINSIDREMFEAANEIDLGTTWGASGVWGKMKRFEKWTKDNGFKIIGWTQMITADMPTWQGAYLKAIEKMNMTEEEAIEYADTIVERTQVGGAEKNLSQWQQGNETMKALTLFYSYFGCLYNLCVRNASNVISKPNSVHFIQAATLMLPLFLEPVLTGFISRKGPDSDDPEKWLKWVFKEAALNPFNMFPIVRDIVSYKDQKSDNAFAQYRVTPLADSIVNLDRAYTEVMKVFKDDHKASGKKATIATMRAIGSTTGFPLFGAQAIRITETTLDWLDGTTPDYEIGNWIRKRKKEKK